jgi:putative Holliday junction resolvase
MSNQVDTVYLSLDYGERRIGIAKSDPTGLIASSLTTLEVRSKAQAIERIADLLQQYQPTALIVGYPLLESGDPSDKCRRVDSFIAALRSIYTGPIHRVDEAYSSQDAAAVVHAHRRQAGRDKKRIDRLAAAVILQRFLDTLPRQPTG